ncbi:MAG: tetratricopeptide repeat protein [bacterium]|nr:tetratricopeptide repeat protein [bacterium]
MPCTPRALRLQIPNTIQDDWHHPERLAIFHMSGITEKYNQAEKLKDEGKYQEAIELLQEILSEDENHVLTHLTLGRIYTLTGDFEKAVAHGQKACELEPNDPFNFTAMSVTFQRVFAGTQDTKYIQLAEDAMAESRRLESLR